MRLIRGTTHLPSNHTPHVITIGAFDGMHLGHQAVLTELKAQAAHHQAKTTVILFEPQPKEFFSRSVLPRISLLRDKLDFLKQFGIDQVVCLRFNATLANLSADDFIQNILLPLNPRHMVLGDDFRFGRGRTGDFAQLCRVGQHHGFTVQDTPTLRNAEGRISSSQVRTALQSGEFTRAQQLLGRPYALLGKVQHGAKLGRKLGFPTINLKLNRPVVVSGIYRVEVFGLQEQPLIGAASIGTRPAVNGKRRLLEVYLLNFTGDCYGKRVKVIFTHEIRAEQDFPSLQALQTQIAHDISKIKAMV